MRSSSGKYWLTCPKTKEQYAGAATGREGFWGGWQDDVQTGHDDIALQSHNPSDYKVFILEVAGTSSTKENILEMEAQWKLKLQSRDMGLNRN